MNGLAIHNVDGLRTTLNEIPPDEPVVLELERDGRFRFISSSRLINETCARRRTISPAGGLTGQVTGNQCELNRWMQHHLIEIILFLEVVFMRPGRRYGLSSAQLTTATRKTRHLQAIDVTAISAATLCSNVFS